MKCPGNGDKGKSREFSTAILSWWKLWRLDKSFTLETSFKGKLLPQWCGQTGRETYKAARDRHDRRIVTQTSTQSVSQLLATVPTIINDDWKYIKRKFQKRFINHSAKTFNMKIIDVIKLFIKCLRNFKLLFSNYRGKGDLAVNCIHLYF